MQDIRTLSWASSPIIRGYLTRNCHCESFTYRALSLKPSTSLSRLADGLNLKYGLGLSRALSPRV